MSRPFARLSAPLGQTYGHADARSAARAHLDTSPVVTIAGAMGVGKSRIAALVATDYAAEHGASVYRYRVGSDVSVEDALRRALAHDGNPNAVLHLDGAEADLEQAAQWLATGEQRRVIVSTRQTSPRFGDDRVTLQPLDADDAVALFVARAQSVGAWVDADNRDDIEHIVAAVDYLPLAIELCAAQAAVLDIPALRVHFEAPSARLDATHRGDSLRHVIASAVTLLTPEQAACFIRCGAFAGRFAFDSAQAVAGATLPVWQTLCARGLVAAAAMTRGRRFWLYGPFRDFARTDHDGDTARAAHLAHYLSAAVIDDDERAANLLEAAARASRCGETTQAHAALCAATATVTDVGRAGAALTQWDTVWPATPIAQQWSSRGRLRLVTGALAPALADLDAACAMLADAASGATADAPLYAETLIARGTARRFGGDASGATADYALALAVPGAHNATVALAEERLGGHLYEQGERDVAAEHLARAHQLYSDIDNDAGAVRVGQALGIVAQEAGDFIAARAAFEAAAAAHRRRGHARFAAIALFDLGALTLEEGAPLAAEARLREAEAALDDVGDVRQAAFARALLAVCAHARGAANEAIDLLERAEQATKKSGDRGYGEAVGHCRLIVTADAASATDVERALAQTPRTDEGRYTRRLLRRAMDRGAANTLEVSPDANSVVVCGEPSMIKSKAARRMLLALCAQHQRAPGEGLSSAALYAAGWPGEKTLSDAAKNRLQVALSALRKVLGSDMLVREADGYALVSTLRVRIVSANPS